MNALPSWLVAVEERIEAASAKRRDVKRRPVKVNSSPKGAVRIEYDVSDAPDIEHVAPHFDIDPGPEPEPEEYETGSFGHRILSKRRSLIRVLLAGVPDIEYLPASDGMLVRGRRHHLAAPRKTGKSLAMLCHWCDVIAAGGNGIFILDRENGAEEYARRLGEILKAKGYSVDEVERIDARLHYLEFPRFTKVDGADFAKEVTERGADLVVFDSQRMFLTDLGLKEDAADDYSTFMHAVVDPLFRAGIATLVLDNTGHSDESRARGSVAKGDLNEVLLVMKQVTEFDRFKKGKVALEIADSRFGTRGEWTMEIGAGVFGSWGGAAGEADNKEFLRAALAVLGEAQASMGVDRLLEQVREKHSVKIGQGAARTLLNRYADDSRLAIRRSSSGRGGFTVVEEVEE